MKRSSDLPVSTTQGFTQTTRSSNGPLSFSLSLSLIKLINLYNKASHKQQDPRMVLSLSLSLSLSSNLSISTTRLHTNNKVLIWFSLGLSLSVCLDVQGQQ
eukprot:TRINITY_DN1225_c1_g1_i1.p3 TRINITY_DN1225_c1_g1~~TRINITY_DN1225_c1_g1_i1.p3  ORF type:complete len:101 (-),score=15.63 TRINITY_DN1225_c1_g1_i1:216-518(-)